MPITFTHNDDLDDLDPIEEAIGRVVVCSNLLTDAIAALYAAMLGSERAYVAALGQDFSGLEQACRAIIEDIGSHTLTQPAKDALREAKALTEERNHVVHGMWFGLPGHDDRRAVYRERRSKAQPEYREWSVTDLRHLAKRLDETAYDLYRLAERWAN